MKYHILFTFSLFICLNFTLTPASAQLIHPEASEYYKVNADRLSSDDIPSIKYKAHPGTVWLKGGLVVEGKMKFIDMDDIIPKLEIKEEGSKKKYKVEFPMIKRIALKGSDSFTIRQDSTIFKWLEPLSGLLREVQSGEISLYDNAYIVDEAYTLIPEHILIAYNYYYDYAAIDQVKDLSELCSSMPYIMDYAYSTGRGFTADPHIINFLVSLYNHPSMLEELEWPQMNILLRDGSHLVGTGLPQPSLFTQNKKYPKYALLHYLDEEGPQVLPHNALESFIWNGTYYRSVWYKHLNLYVWAEEFQYEGLTYYVAQEIKDESDMYFSYGSSEDNGMIFLVPEGNDDGYKRAHVIPAVRKAYLKSASERQ